MYAGIERTSSKAKELEGWRSNNMGIFPVVAMNVMGDYMPKEDQGVTIRDVNGGLDALAIAHSPKEKAAAMAPLLQRMTNLQLRWLLGIIVRDVKIGVGEKTVLRDYHPYAEQCFNVCCDMKRMMQQIQPYYNLRTRCPAFELQPGEIVRAMCAARSNSAEDAYRRITAKHGPGFYVETKFDGERMQLHRNGACNYFSRTMIDHGPLPSEGRETHGYTVFDSVVSRQLRFPKCILDGEFVLWNTALDTFEPFGFVASFTRAAREGRARDERLDAKAARMGPGSAEARDPPKLCDLELRFMAFDILYTMVDGQYRSVIDRPLRERKALLEAAVEGAPDGGHPIGSLRGGIYTVVPGRYCRDGARGLAAVEEAIAEAVAANEEGVMIKVWGSCARTHVSSACH